MTKKQSSPEMSSLAADYVKYTETRLFADALHNPKELVAVIRSLSASVLSQDETPKSPEEKLMLDIIQSAGVKEEENEQAGVLDGPDDGAEYQGEGADAEKEAAEAEVVVSPETEAPEA